MKLLRTAFACLALCAIGNLACDLSSFHSSGTSTVLAPNMSKAIEGEGLQVYIPAL